MFERFTDRARRVVVVAQEEAKALNHEYIGLEHILLGLVKDPDAVSTRAMMGLGVTLIPLRERVVEIFGMRDGPAPSHIPFTPVAKRVLELALREALQLNHNYIGAEHILLGFTNSGLVRAGEVVPDAFALFEDFHVTMDQVRQAVIAELASIAASSVYEDAEVVKSEFEEASVVIDGEDVVIRTSGTLIDFDGDRDGPSFKLTIRRPDGRDQLVTFLFGVAEADG